MGEEQSALELLHAHKGNACKTPECGHAIDSHVNFKSVKGEQWLLIYC